MTSATPAVQPPKDGIPRQLRMCAPSELSGSSYMPIFRRLEGGLIKALASRPKEEVRLSVSLVTFTDKMSGESVGLPISRATGCCFIDPSGSFDTKDDAALQEPSKAVQSLKAHEAGWTSVDVSEATVAPTGGEEIVERYLIYRPESSIHLRVDVCIPQIDYQGPEGPCTVFRFNKGPDLWWRVVVQGRGLRVDVNPSLLRNQYTRMIGHHSHGLSVAVRDLLRNAESLATMADGMPAPALCYENLFTAAGAAASFNVQDHYDRKTRNQVSQNESEVGALRKYNNLVKRVLIEKFVPPSGPVVLDLACGHGQDLWKYSACKPRLYIGIDISSEAIEEAKRRYGESEQRLQYRAVFIQGNLEDETTFKKAILIAEQEGVCCAAAAGDTRVFDTVSMQLAMHYLMSSEEAAQQLLARVSAVLKPGGNFIGTIPCSETISNRLKHTTISSDGSAKFGNDHYSVTFEKEELAKLCRTRTAVPQGESAAAVIDHKMCSSIWGVVYRFWLIESIDDQAEYMVPFKSFDAAARGSNLKCVLHANFGAFLDHYETKCDVVRTFRRKHSGVVLSPEEEPVFNFYTTFVFTRSSS
ncbi:hypothetical protein FOL47_003332 [Perkinsus chesapeaki]|uniref:mRNA (guanine-N(7))-methyltransferase n=1 Tax=Perkinsus chesapeaki TaxID=330153 RepID=A0A7J6M8V3_PERCH|nr:hypothetical protein FOL47_003332 [Perkinsus chesapeaki]